MPKSDHRTGDLLRPVFFDRQQLTKEDLNCLLDYLRARQRRHNRYVVGWGVTCGLAVSRIDGAPWAVRVGEGYAVTPGGEEIAVPAESEPFDACEAARDCLGIPGPCPAPLDLSDGDPPPPSGETVVAFGEFGGGDILPNPLTLAGTSFTAVDDSGASLEQNRIRAIGALVGLQLDSVMQIALPHTTDRLQLSLVSRAPDTRIVVMADDGSTIDERTTGGVPNEIETEIFTDPAGQIASIRIFGGPNDPFLVELRVADLAAGQVYLAICPDETPACFKPAVPELCRPPGENVFPSRIWEGYRLQILCDLPPSHERPGCREIEEWVCGPAHIPCPPVPEHDCVVVATLTIGRNGIMAVDEFTDRRLLTPQGVQALLAACRCQRPPTAPPTLPTDITRPTQITLPTQFTDFTLPTLPTRFTDFTLPTQPTLPTQFTDFTLPTQATLPTQFTDFTLPTQATLPTQFTEATLPTQFTEATLPTQFTEATRPTQFTAPTQLTGFTGFTGLPTSLTSLTGLPTLSATAGPAGFEFDVGRARALEVSAIPGVGRVRGARLNESGIADVAGFIERSPEALSGILGVSEVRVAEMQAEARALTLKGPD